MQRLKQWELKRAIYEKKPLLSQKRQSKGQIV